MARSRRAQAPSPSLCRYRSTTRSSKPAATVPRYGQYRSISFQPPSDDPTAHLGTLPREHIRAGAARSIMAAPTCSTCKHLQAPAATPFKVEGWLRKASEGVATKSRSIRPVKPRPGASWLVRVEVFCLRRFWNDVVKMDIEFASLPENVTRQSTCPTMALSG